MAPRLGGPAAEVEAGMISHIVLLVANAVALVALLVLTPAGVQSGWTLVLAVIGMWVAARHLMRPK